VLNLVASNSPLSTATPDEAINLAANAVSASAECQAHLGLASSSLQATSATQSDYQNFAKTPGSNLAGVDVAAVTAQLSTYQAQLTASYSAISKIRSLNLAGYLR
jgi:flagellar hook-associated protein 3 FlgL